MTHFALRTLFLSGLVLGLIGHVGNPSALFGEPAGALLREAGLYCSTQRAHCRIAGFDLGAGQSEVMAGLIATAHRVPREKIVHDIARDMARPDVLALLDERVVPQSLVDAAQTQLARWVADHRNIQTARLADAERVVN